MGPTASSDSSRPRGDGSCRRSSGQRPCGLSDGVEKLHLIDPDLAPPDVQELWRQAKDLFLYHATASDYRVLPAWPDFLRIAVEDILTPVALTAEYEETARRIRAIARNHVAGLSDVGGVSRRQMSDSLSGPEIAGLTGLLFMYNHFSADITIAMIRVKEALTELHQLERINSRSPKG
jgi:hypothetical protein